ncbi:mucin-5AC-like isoform X2 [Acanthaster planci]|uniref:Mucin-5AC-like isoform X2 n=1 Tax=Acanthaster planci TaxID=133434 RepID=A0A8B7ZJC3_ACAPL|nr:mucin-5AC-like isoform X2 [Acanthaster planci]
MLISPRQQDTTGEEAAVTSSTIAAKPTATVTPVPVLVPTTSSQAQGPQIQPPVQGRPVVFIRPTSDGAGPNQQMLPGYPVFTSQRFPAPGMTQQTFAFPGATPMIRVVQHHSSMPDARGPPRPATPTTTSTVTVTTSGTTATSTLAGPAQGFQIHFHHRPGYPPQPVIRLIQDTPPPRPGVHRCMHVHHGQPVFRTPTPATAPQTTTAPPTRTHISAPPPSNPSAPPTAAATAAAAARQPSHGTHSAKSAQSPPLSERKPEAEIHRPELAELAQRIHNLSADVKTIKPGSRGVPLDPREKQRREAAEASNARRKEIKAKVKTLRAENVSAASEIIQDSDSMNLPAPDDEALGISSTSSNESTRRRKRRKRVKQQSPALGEAEQSIVTEGPAQTSDARKEKSTLVDSAKSGGQTESASDSKPDAEDEPAHDSDDSTSSESDHEEATNTEQKQKDPNLTRTSTETTHPVPVGPSLPEGFHDSDNEPETAGDTPLNSHPNNENQDNAFPQSTKDQKDSQVSQESPTEAIADHASANHSTRQPSADMTGMEKTGEPGANLENQLAPSSELEQQTRSKEVTETRSCYDGNNHSGTESQHGAAAIVLDQKATCIDTADVGVQPKLSESSKEIKQERSGHLSGSKTASPEVMSSQSTQSNASMESSNKITIYTEAEMGSGSSDASQNNLEVKPKSSRSTVFKTSTTRGVDGVPIPSSLPDTDVARTHRPQQHLQTLSTSLTSSSEQHILRGESEELQRDQIDVEHKQLALERKCLNCERRNLLLKEERLQIEQDRLQAERDRLQALQEQVQLQRDQLELDRTRYELEREHLEVNRERLQVERNHLQQEEQRGEDSKMILQSLQEISQTLQMSVNLSLQGYGFPMSYEVNDRGATAVTEEYLQPQSFLQVESQEMWPAEETDIPGGGAVGGGTFYSEGEISGDEWTVVGRARGSSSHRESSRSAGQDQWVADSTVTSQSSVDTLAQGSRPPELAAPSPDVTHGSTQQVQNLTKTGSSKEASGMQKGEKSSFGQKSSGDRSLSPVHGLSSMQERQRTRNNPNRRNHRQGRPSDNRRWHDRRNWKPNDSRNEPKK